MAKRLPLELIVLGISALAIIGLSLLLNKKPKSREQSPYQIGWTMGYTAAGVEHGTIPTNRLGEYRQWWLTQSNANKEFQSNVNAGYKAGYRDYSATK